MRSRCPGKLKKKRYGKLRASSPFGDGLCKSVESADYPNPMSSDDNEYEIEEEEEFEDMEDIGYDLDTESEIDDII